MHLSKPQQNKYIPSLLAALIFLDPFSQAYCLTIWAQGMLGYQIEADAFKFAEDMSISTDVLQIKVIK